MRNAGWDVISGFGLFPVAAACLCRHLLVYFTQSEKNDTTAAPLNAGTVRPPHLHLPVKLVKTDSKYKPVFISGSCQSLSFTEQEKRKSKPPFRDGKLKNSSWLIFGNGNDLSLILPWQQQNQIYLFPWLLFAFFPVLNIINDEINFKVLQLLPL